jgi:ABC-type Fe3+ transport system permease subunit
MGRVFQSLSEGLSKFIYGWLVPSAISLGVVLLLLGELAASNDAIEDLMQALPDDGAQQILAFGLATVALSTVLSLALAVPTTRLLEGYWGPPFLFRRLRARKIRRLRRLIKLADRRDVPP